jgi:formate dehydrogenase maturation protein FdhE
MANWRKTRDYRLWKVAVIRRDGRCVICGSMKKRHAHHIHGAKYFPELRFEEDNGVCLCSVCHMNFHCNFKRSYREKCDMDDFCNFKALIHNMMEHVAKQAAKDYNSFLGLLGAAPDPEASQILEDNLWDLV